MKRLCYVLASILVLSIIRAGYAQDQLEPIRATDLFKLQQLESITASPDGRSIAYTARSIVEKVDEPGEYEYRSHLFVIPVSNTLTPQQLTFDDREASQPAWHPDGDQLVFVRRVEGTPQLFVLSLYGGEARQITRVEHGATQPRWSPDGTYILFASALPASELTDERDQTLPLANERPGREGTPKATADPDGTLDQLRAWLDQNHEDHNPRLLTRLNLQAEQDLEPTPKTQHYFTLDVTRPAAQPRRVTFGPYSFSDATWLPSGKQLLLTGLPQPERPPAPHPDHVRDRNLFLADINTGTLHLLLDIEGYALRNPRLSPDGRLLTFLLQDLDDPIYAQTELGVFALDGRTAPELLTLGFDRDLQSPAWSNDTWNLFFSAPSQGGFPLYRLAYYDGKPALPSPDPITPTPTDSLAMEPVTTARAHFQKGELIIRHPKIEQLTSQEKGVRDFEVTAATVYYILTEASNPYEVYASNMEFTDNQRLTDHNASWLKNKRLSLPEAATVRLDTLRFDYWVMQPSSFNRRDSYPMVLQIHGGPASMWGPGEATMWHEFQYLAAQGYGIVYGNPRGSGGYGYAFEKSNYQDWGTGPATDILAISSEAIRKNRWLDRSRQAVMGGSYGGYLTAWVVAHDQRFKAAIAQRGVYDLATFFGEGNAWRLVPYHFGGYPWQDGASEGGTSTRDLLFRNSPLTYVEQIQTPLLIIHSDDDLRTGVSQSEMLYRSLKVLERPVEYIRYPKAGHDLSRTGNPKQRLDRLVRMYEFLTRYLGQ